MQEIDDKKSPLNHKLKSEEAEDGSLSSSLILYLFYKVCRILRDARINEEVKQPKINKELETILHEVHEKQLSQNVVHLLFVCCLVCDFFEEVKSVRNDFLEFSKDHEVPEFVNESNKTRKKITYLEELKKAVQRLLPSEDSFKTYDEVSQKINQMPLSSAVIASLEESGPLWVLRYSQSVSLGVLWGIYLHLSTSSNVSANDTKANGLMEDIEKIYSFNEKLFNVKI